MGQARIAQETAARTRHLNIWVGADEALSHSVPGRKRPTRRCRSTTRRARNVISNWTWPAAPTLQPWRSCSRAGMPIQGAHLRCVCPMAAVTEARNASYPGWAAPGHLMVTPGNETDFDEIESDVRQLCSRFNVVSAGYDPWQSAQMSQRLRAEGAPMHEFRATTQNFSPAINELDAAMLSGRPRHDGNPVLTWCIGNVVGKQDRRGNCIQPSPGRTRRSIRPSRS
jgi:terminase large subunit-like protein